MAGISAGMKNRVMAALDATSFGQRGFSVQHDDREDAAMTISFTARSEYRFAISMTPGGYTTGECPGIKSDQAESFQRGDFEACLLALRAWADRIADRESADILDEFGGVADRNPWLPTN